jgi:hypothetical protein
VTAIALELRVVRAVDFAHPAFAERRHDLVGAEPRSRVDRHIEVKVRLKADTTSEGPS